MSNQKLTVALTGASGYIGSNLLKELSDQVHTIALSRNADHHKNTSAVSWRSCDLFSLPEAKAGLRGADIAVYLVHSMLPSAKLTQGRFEDMDVILADNFAKAAQANGVKKIIYLTGIIPEPHNKLSRHLKSRLEVEEILGAYGTPVTAIRAGLIVGPKGSSFPILSKLVRRLPFMLLPKWAQTPAQPTAIEDVIPVLIRSILDEKLTDIIVDVGGPEILTYRDMMQETAKLIGKSPKFLNLPVMTPSLSKLWIRLITGAPKNIVYPLIESLPHHMIVSDKYRVEGLSDGKIRFREAAKKALHEESKSTDKTFTLPSLPSHPANVRSVQRIIIPNDKQVTWIAAYYVKWLGNLSRFIETTIDEEFNCKVYFTLFKKPLLEMDYSFKDSTSDRVLFYITDGLLSKISPNNKGRLEFRRIPNKNEGIVAIHDYLPSLPWFFYHYSQAKIHLIVMGAFRKHLKKLNQEEEYSVNHNLQKQQLLE